ncbi:MAG: DNA-3-methyladenine glycosylase I [Marinilabiliales bacterium]|nr:DNA-3-methyladenine glycosylase I [Marinilabiliales bacterium]
MEPPKSYCEAVERMEPDNLHRIYHDTAYGFPIGSDDELFGRLILEIFQAGLSWTTILKKQENFRNAFDGFQLTKVAAYGPTERERLLGDAGIIRNRLKIDAAIYNAGVILTLQEQHGSFLNWLELHHPLPLTEWVKLFKKTFRFTGGEIVHEFLMSTGYLPGSHIESCPVYQQLTPLKPAWMRR